MATSPITKAYYSTPEGQIHYRYLKSTVANVSKDPVVLLHMSACSSLYFVDLIENLAAEGHDVYAWDMPGFGNSYDIDYKPNGIVYYVEKAMLGVKHWGLSKFHVLGHHSGASIATELAAVHGDQVLSLTIVGPALLTPEEQVAHLEEAGLKEEVVPFNKPVADGSHLLKTWDQLLTNGEWDPEVLNGQTLDALRAWKGRLQIYRNVFSQPALEVLSQVKCPVLGMCAPDDSLFPKFGRVKELLPSSTSVVVKGVDFEPLRDAEGICKAMVEFYGKL